MRFPSSCCQVAAIFVVGSLCILFACTNAAAAKTQAQAQTDVAPSDYQHDFDISMTANRWFAHER
jgi:hypothetical protein